MSSTKSKIAELILPLAVKGTFQYRIKDEDQDFAEVGKRCIVQFGKKKIYTALIYKILESEDYSKKIKDISEIIDEEPVVNLSQIKLFEWIRNYYMCSLGEVLRAALPSGLKLNSESKIEILDRKWEDRSELLDDKSYSLLKVLDKKEHLTIAEAAAVMELSNPQRILKKLADNEFIGFFEQVLDRYRPKKIKMLRLSDDYNSSEILEALFDSLEHQTKQIDVLMLYLKESNCLESPEKNQLGVSKSELVQQGASPSSINTLVKHNILEEFEKKISRFKDVALREKSKIELSESQGKAKKEINIAWKENKIPLLHGITGSGKTEVYIELIKEEIKKGKQCLYLLPEIALTTHIVQRLRIAFGDKIGVYHSRFSDNERVEIWENLRNKKYDLLIGVRSSLFLPFQNLGLIIVDEEHDSSYKQQNPAPRYNSRETAIMLSSIHKGRILLGSATPSFESYYLSSTQRWKLVELKNRYHENSVLPKIELLNFLDDKKKGKVKSIFSTDTIEAIQSTLDDHKQIIIFQNRRGYSPYLQCQECAYIPMCHQCDVSLTLHQYLNQLRCHYCGYHEETPRSCPRCGANNFQKMGTGTEMVEEATNELFPNAKIQRMDLDSTRGKYAHQIILEAFERKEIDILVGTQMVSKGLDFERVELVVVLGIDRLLHFPDFRSLERTFQMVTQVSGRAGRKSNRGRVIIQSNDPKKEIFNFILRNDYQGFYKAHLEDRMNFQYPPFTRVIKLIVKSRLEFELEKDAFELGKILKQTLGSKRILGPEKPPVSRVRNLHIREFLIKYERDDISPKAFKEKLGECIDYFNDNVSDAPNLRIIIDVDSV